MEGERSNKHALSRRIKDIPIISKTQHIPKTLIKWKSRTRNYNNKTLHFFVEDHKFNAIWTNPKAFNRTLKKYEAIITPDFSLYLNTPEPMQIWNTYRNRWLGHYWQKQGLTVIPSVAWSNHASFDYCFEGIEESSIVAISGNGIKKNDLSFYYFINGIEAMIHKIKPHSILCYGEKFKDELGNKYPNLFRFYPYQKYDKI